LERSSQGRFGSSSAWPEHIPSIGLTLQKVQTSSLKRGKTMFAQEEPDRLSRYVYLTLSPSGALSAQARCKWRTTMLEGLQVVNFDPRKVIVHSQVCGRFHENVMFFFMSLFVLVLGKTVFSHLSPLTSSSIVLSSSSSLFLPPLSSSFLLFPPLPPSSSSSSSSSPSSSSHDLLVTLLLLIPSHS